MEWMKEKICQNAEIVCEIPAEKAIAVAGLKGRELPENYSAIAGLADFLAKNK